MYSFGICLWEIYCCDMPYPDLSFSEVTSAVVHQVHKLIPRFTYSCATGNVVIIIALPMKLRQLVHI